jgi:hypothetical protein
VVGRGMDGPIVVTVLRDAIEADDVMTAMTREVL